MTASEKLKHVDLGPQSLDRLGELLEDAERKWFETTMRNTADALGDRTVWNVNSTAEGGGVAELLSMLLPYLVGSGWNVRWAVMFGDRDFFDVTKGLHNALHGAAPSEDTWDKARDAYPATAQRNAEELLAHVRPGDIAIVHDPQAAGLIPALVDAGVLVSWQCHIGTDTPNDCTRRAWKFLCDFIESAHRYVFTRASYLWDGLDADRLRLIPPSIDAFSSKNASMTDEQVRATLVAAGILNGEQGDVEIVRRADRVGGERLLPAEAPIVLQVSRWDRLKDPAGFLRMFADHLTDIEDLHAIYAGPEVDGVDDDPESADVHAECSRYWRSLPSAVQERLHLLAVPMTDVDENAAVVNALQRRADVVVQKSLEEGFGLTVAEAMWKRRPVVASRVGGIQDQIEHGESGLLVDDPHDIPSFADSVRTLIGDRECAERLGSRAERRVHEHFLAPRQLTQYAELVSELL
jgi:trehalose synthase